jgi:DNA-binding CsgD family transcriptional regulator
MDMLADSGISGAAFHSEGSEMFGGGLAFLLDELAYGVLVTGINGELLHTNQTARRELSERRVLSLRHNLLRACVAGDREILNEAMTKVAEGKRSLITLIGDGGPSLTLATIPLKTGSVLRPHAAALLFSRASIIESLMSGLFARNHGLTRTEEHVLHILCQGYSTPDIAQQMKVAVSTVRSHVRSLCAKTRSCGVRELVNRMAVLPPVGPVSRDEPLH